MDWNYYDMFWDIFSKTSLVVSILGFVISVVGLIYSYKSWKNTKNIYEAFNTEKLKNKYRTKHHEFVSKLTSILCEIRNGGRDYNIIFDLYQICMGIYALNDGWPQYNQNTFKDILDYLSSISNDQQISEKEWFQVQKSVTDTLALLERIAVLEKIDEPNDNSDSEKV